MNSGEGCHNIITLLHFRVNVKVIVPTWGVNESFLLMKKQGDRYSGSGNALPIQLCVAIQVSLVTTRFDKYCLS